MEEIQYWIKHLDDETEKREAEVMTLKIDLEKVTFDLSVAQDTYDSRTAAIEDWLAYKKKKEEKDRRAEREKEAAIKIQVIFKLNSISLYTLIKFTSDLVVEYGTCNIKFWKLRHVVESLLNL